MLIIMEQIKLEANISLPASNLICLCNFILVHVVHAQVHVVLDDVVHVTLVHVVQSVLAHEVHVHARARVVLDDVVHVRVLFL
jgi:hypothetical protein